MAYHFNDKDAQCPYCEEWVDICHDDGYGYSEDETHQQECNHCGKTFTYTTAIIYSYETSKADCLNGGNHKYEPTICYPRIATKMRCAICDDERPLTAEEKIKLKIEAP